MSNVILQILSSLYPTSPEFTPGWGIYLFFILLHFALMMGYLFVFHFITFCSDGGVFICFSFYYNEKQINTPSSEQNVIK
jgi:hypothetical protein